MAGYTKLFSSILASSIWNETDVVRIVWITLLAMSDKNGTVDASVGGIAHQARKTREDTQTALAVLMAPDEDSKNPEHEGRRIEPLEHGGFAILNYSSYRDGLNDDPESVSSRERMRKFRSKRNGDVTLRNTGVGVGDGDGSEEGESEGKKPAKAKPIKKPYGEFRNVRLTDEEYEKLKVAQGEARVKEAIEILGDWKESKGKANKSDYAAMKSNSWVWEKVRSPSIRSDRTPVKNLGARTMDGVNGK